jgi:tetratricopeptide (TPR) repeat protein
VQIQPAPPPDVLTRARTALDADDLDEAGKLLAEARARGDSVDVQLLLGELAEKRGNRLEALAHLHRATRIAPDQAEPHARLASLLNLLGQAQAACREAKLALGRDGKNSLARVTSDNSCKEPR